MIILDFGYGGGNIAWTMTSVIYISRNSRINWPGNSAYTYQCGIPKLSTTNKQLSLYPQCRRGPPHHHLFTPPWPARARSATTYRYKPLQINNMKTIPDRAEISTETRATRHLWHPSPLHRDDERVRGVQMFVMIRTDARAERT